MAEQPRRDVGVHENASQENSRQAGPVFKLCEYLEQTLSIIYNNHLTLWTNLIYTLMKPKT